MLNRFPTNLLYTPSQVREIDRLAIQAGTPGIVLMRRAAQAAWREASRVAADSGPVVVLCGAGNNGGDGYLLAREAAAAGKPVQVFTFAEPRGDALLAKEALQADGILLQSHQQLRQETLSGAAVLVDALLGTGASGPPRDAYANAIALVNRAGRPVVALDLPSGICADTGRLTGSEAVCADLTVTFIGIKRGLLTDAATEHTGTLVFADLGVDCGQLLPAAAATLCELEALALQLPWRRANHHKNRSGHVLVVGGDYGMAGATVLAGRAAFCAGAGLVSVVTRPAHVAAVLAAQPELMVHGLENPASLLPLLDRANVILVGPGLGQSAWSQQMLAAVGNSHTPAVLDADALNLVARKPQSKPAAAVLLTPHPGEARRLAEGMGVDPAQDRFSLAQDLQQTSNTAVLLKGAGTIIAQGNQTSLCPYGHPVLSTAGSGDVLGGVAAALLAQGVPLQHAPQLAACLHGLAGEHWANTRGPRGMLAGDLVIAIRELLNSEAILRLGPHSRHQ